MQIPENFLIPHKWYAAIGSQLKNMSLKFNNSWLFVKPPIGDFENFDNCQPAKKYIKGSDLGNFFAYSEVSTK